MKLPVLAVLLLCATNGISREITHEDIKDAMLSLVHMMRENNEKLERHEARERQLGEQLKKTIAMLTKRVTAVDGLKVQLTKLDDRITGIEHLITQRDERERIQMQKTTDSLEDLRNHLETWFTDAESKIAEVNLQPKQMSNDTFEILSKLNNTESVVSKQISQLEVLVKTESIKEREEILVNGNKAEALLAEIQDVRRRTNSLEVLVNKVQEHIQNVREIPEEKQLDSLPIIQQQARTLVRLQELLQATSDHIQELPRTNEVQSLHNETQTLLQETKHAMKDIITQGVDDIETKVTEAKEEIKDAVGALRMDLANNAERVNQELRDLSKGQSVMVSMADHVLDTKKRVEYGVHQILLEVGDLVKEQSTNINNTLNQRFDGISNDIMDNQNGALANLTTKMEQEMNQVWRQINVMYQQMTESAKALDKLHQQNEAYVNGTTSTMGGMESKVGEITKRMKLVDDNLNYLLGRLSLVTQEFNQIKSGLGAALDNIKASFKEVQEKANDLSHPGPHPVPENYGEFTESETKKPDGKPMQEYFNHIFTPQTN